LYLIHIFNNYYNDY